MLPVLVWSYGQWTPGVMQPLLWTNRTYGPVRHLRPTLDFLQFAAVLEEAIVKSKYALPTSIPLQNNRIIESHVLWK
jgi:hypothetical protein